MLDPRTQDQLNTITEKVIGCAYQVSNTLVSGFLEKIYEQALCIELNKAGLNYEQQKPTDVYYKGQIIGTFICDLLIESSVIIELKASKAIDGNHIAQTMNYLKATELKLGLIINFGRPRIEIKRVVLDF